MVGHSNDLSVISIYKTFFSPQLSYLVSLVDAQTHFHFLIDWYSWYSAHSIFNLVYAITLPISLSDFIRDPEFVTVKKQLQISFVRVSNHIISMSNGSTHSSIHHHNKEHLKIIRCLDIQSLFTLHIHRQCKEHILHLLHSQ